MPDLKKIAGRVGTAVGDLATFGGFSMAKKAIGKRAQEYADKEVGLQDSLDKGKKLQILKDRIKSRGDMAKDTSDWGEKNQGLRGLDITNTDKYKARKDAYEKSYNFGGGQTNIDKNMEKEAKMNNWKRKSITKNLK